MYSLFKLNNTAPLTLSPLTPEEWVLGYLECELLEWTMNYVKLNYDTNTF